MWPAASTVVVARSAARTHSRRRSVRIASSRTWGLPRDFGRITTCGAHCRALEWREDAACAAKDALRAAAARELEARQADTARKAAFDSLRGADAAVGCAAPLRRRLDA